MHRISLVKNHLSVPTFSSKLYYELTYSSQIAIISLNSPTDLNVLSQAMRSELGELLKALDHDPKVKGIVLQSSLPKVFCAGANIKEFPTLSENSLKNESFSEILITLKKPMIAAVNGLTFGGGFELVLNCDIIICSKDAKFAFPEIKLGIIPGMGGTQRFTAMVGRSIANRYILTGEYFTAQQAKEWGVVSEVYEIEEIKKKALELAQKVADLSMYTSIAAKDVVKEADELGINGGLRFERRGIQGLIDMQGAKEGIDAFIKKRRPNFNDI